ncbi:MAG: hypothetical protein BMS9Abin22_446 [Gammaproteobacteria bacterium]|nr:MAG: hypothetical protein BMS9Abin22_446 [Gammaproteobacteria bacterium]
MYCFPRHALIPQRLISRAWIHCVRANGGAGDGIKHERSFRDDRIVHQLAHRHDVTRTGRGGQVLRRCL